MNERETGEFIATQKAMARQLRDIKTSVKELDAKIDGLAGKVYTGRGIIVTLAGVSGCVGAVATVVISKMIGGTP